MPIETFEDLLTSHPEHKLGWREEYVMGKNGGLFLLALNHPKIGRLERVAVTRDDGSVIYDHFQIHEGPVQLDGTRKPSSGAIIVPFYEESNTKHIGLIKRIREVVIDPDLKEPLDEQLGIPCGHPFWDRGRESIELPRGYGQIDDNTDEETAVRELGEETNKYALEVKKLGNVNPNTAYYVTPGISVFAAKVDPKIEAGIGPDKNEPIMKCDFRPYDEVKRMVANQEIYCGFSLAGFALFDAHSL